MSREEIALQLTLDNFNYSHCFAAGEDDLPRDVANERLAKSVASFFNIVYENLHINKDN